MIGWSSFKGVGGLYINTEDSRLCFKHIYVNGNWQQSLLLSIFGRLCCVNPYLSIPSVAVRC